MSGVPACGWRRGSGKRVGGVWTLEGAGPTQCTVTLVWGDTRLRPPFAQPATSQGPVLVTSIQSPLEQW